MFRHTQFVTAAEEGAVCILTLNHPEKRNALSAAMMGDLLDALNTAEDASGVRAVILAAAGPVFSAGHDLAELSGRARADYDTLFALCTDVMLAIQSLSKPVIAEVQGLATAAGCQLVAACDLAVASEAARFATPGVKIGLFCTTPMVPLVRAIGRKRAMQMLLTGEPIDAPAALAWGLVNRVVPADQLRQSSLQLAAQIAEASAATVATGKRAFYEQIAMDERSAYAAAKDVMATNAVAPDAQEGIGAFLAKRRPVWRA